MAAIYKSCFASKICKTTSSEQNKCSIRRQFSLAMPQKRLSDINRKNHKIRKLGLSLVWGKRKWSDCSLCCQSQLTYIWGEKMFCVSFCASLIAGSRRAFLCVDCVRLCLFVTERVRTEPEWNVLGVNVRFSKSLYMFVWFLFFVTWKLLWTENNQC